MTTRNTLFSLALLALSLSFLGVGCASPGQTIESAMDELAKSPNLTTNLEATPCGKAGEAVASATTAAHGLRATATLALRVEQECQEPLDPIPMPRSSAPPAPTVPDENAPRPPPTPDESATRGTTSTTPLINHQTPDERVSTHIEVSHASAPHPD